MKAEYGTAPQWAHSTNDDKSNQLPDSINDDIPCQFSAANGSN
jgi:hypothetical protein